MRDRYGRFVKGHKLGLRFGHGQKIGHKFEKGHIPWIKGRVFTNTYIAIHHWAQRNIPIGENCMICGENKKRLYRANLEHTYKRIEKDWVTLCARCHRLHDMFNNNYYNKWIKARKGGI